MPKIDLKKENKEIYYPSPEYVSVVEVPQMKFLMIDGEGDPNTSQKYQDAMESLFPVSYRAKFISKKEISQDYVVMPLEGLWWADNMEEFSLDDKESWKWTAMIRQPNFINADIIKKAVKEIKAKKNPSALAKIRFGSLEEGLSAQIMHIGPYGEAEIPTVEKLHEFIKNNRYSKINKHHEIYLSDVRRKKPERLKTVIRQPIK